MATLVRAGSATLDAPAAAAYARALAAGAPDNVTSSWRDPDAQMALYVAWVKRVPGYNFALHPSKSDHCKGLAIDLWGVKAKTWFRVYGRDYGWIFTDGREDWHIAYRIEHDKHLTDTPPVTPIEHKEWDEMASEAQIEALVERQVNRVIAPLAQAMTALAAIHGKMAGPDSWAAHVDTRTKQTVTAVANLETRTEQTVKAVANIETGIAVLRKREGV